jgi:hypothetical protein
MSEPGSSLLWPWHLAPLLDVGQGGSEDMVLSPLQKMLLDNAQNGKLSKTSDFEQKDCE